MADDASTSDRFSVHGDRWNPQSVTMRDQELQVGVTGGLINGHNQLRVVLVPTKRIQLPLDRRLRALTIAYAQTDFADHPLGPAEEEALATLDGMSDPLPDLSAALCQIAASQVPTILTMLLTEL